MWQIITQCLCTYTLQHLHSRQLKIGVVVLEHYFSMYVIHFNKIVIFLIEKMAIILTTFVHIECNYW